MKKDWVLYIDTLKGITILLVIIGHIADGYLRANIFTENRNVLHFTYNIIYSFHMPLFLFISGYVYYLAYFKNKTVDKKRIIIQFKYQMTQLFQTFICQFHVSPVLDYLIRRI